MSNVPVLTTFLKCFLAQVISGVIFVLEAVTNPPASFQKAITASGFGKFNYLLLIITIPCAFCSVLDTTNMSYVIPAAECDLSLTLFHKGVLNASCYIGMIASSFMWGFLSDTLGRRKLLIYGYAMDCVCNLICAFSVNFTMLFILKLISGFIIAGPYAMLTTYTCEFHSCQHRTRIVIIVGAYFGSGNLILPLLAWGIMPLRNLHIASYEFHSWQLFIATCALSPFISGIAFIFLPESPKFLMTTGENEKALEVFKKVYSMNTGHPPETYPIKQLVNEIEENNTRNENSRRKSHGGKITANRSRTQALKEGCQQIKPLFYPPFAAKAVLVLVLQFFTIWGANTLRLWLPQLFTTISKYHQEYGTSTSLCEMLDNTVSLVSTITKNSTLAEESCVLIASKTEVYINSIIVGVSIITAYIIVTFTINLLSKRIYLGIMYALAGSSALGLIWSNSINLTLTLSSIYVSVTSVATTTVISAAVELFPTSLRTMIVSLAMMLGRTGSILGNLIFPTLLSLGCKPPFILISGVVFVCILVVILLPEPTEEFT